MSDDLKNQGGLVKEFFNGEGERTLILLDACRYDFFEKLYPRFFEGELIKCHNEGVSWTYDWFSKFCRNLNDVTLFTAAPVAVQKWKDKPVDGYDPKNHFREIPNWQEFDWDHEKGTSPPEKINKVVRRWDCEKRLVRYLNPHPPLIETPLEDVTRGKGKTQRVKEKLENGEITEEELREAYEKNVRIALEGAMNLACDLGGEVVVTSDHGTALNESGYLFHAKRYPEMPCLNHLPWLEVKEAKTLWTGRTDELTDRFSGSQHEDVRKEMVSTMDEPESVLNVGCGPNYLKKHLDCECVGLDFEDDWPGVDVVADARDIPFPDDSFHYCTTKTVLQHIPNWKEALREILRVGENVLLAERVWDEETEIVYREPVLRRRFNPQDLLDELGGAEFKISESDDRLGFFHKKG